ncbi:MAG: hypothetical protein Tsb008_13460 [Rhodothalassiaceae bacterium]
MIFTAKMDPNGVAAVFGPGFRASHAPNAISSSRRAAHDACALVSQRQSDAHILIDQGEADPYLSRELRPELFEDACSRAGQRLTLRRQKGYDHSYFFIASFIDDHIAHHAEGLRKG